MESPLPLRSWVNHQSWVSSVPSYLAGVGDVTAAAALTANYIVVGDDGVKGVKAGAGAGATINFGSGAAANQSLNFVGTNTGTILWVNAASSWLFADAVAFNGLLTAAASAAVTGTLVVVGNITATTTVTASTSLTTPLVYGGTGDGDDITVSSTSHANKGTTTIGDPGDVVIGDGTERDMYPQTDAKVNCGKSTNRFGDGWFATGVRTQCATDDVSSPPTDAELDTAFGTPAAVGAGFVGVLDDNGAGAAVYLCASDGTNWWHSAMTKAV